MKTVLTVNEILMLAALHRGAIVKASDEGAYRMARELQEGGLCTPSVVETGINQYNRPVIVSVQFSLTEYGRRQVE